MRPMGWVRGHKRHGALVALAALALQIVLSFGHMHLDGIRADVAHTAVTVPHQTAASQTSTQIPGQNPGADDDYCAICASIYLASTSVISHAPLLPTQFGFRRVEHLHNAARGIAAPRRFAFQSRAPPAV
jgi:hypothetical protein